MTAATTAGGPARCAITPGCAVALRARLETELRLLGLDLELGPTARALFDEHDPRLGAACVGAARSGWWQGVELYERVAARGPKDAGRDRFALALADFGRRRPAVERAAPRLEVFDEVLSPQLAVLLEAARGHFGAFVELQLDVPGPNALVREGVVKRWFLPDGTAVASKRPNPSKPGRFATEQRILTEAASRLATVEDVRVVTPFARVDDSDRVYALTTWRCGPTLEELLLTEERAAARAAHLASYRRLLDLLYDHGILWNDMSPRNLVVEQTPDGEVLNLLDFEKSAVVDVPLDDASRVVHCRGQLAVEELAILCDPDEVEHCLHGYFRPSSWDTEDPQPLAFAQRVEVAAVLAGRGDPAVPAGVYNRTDLEIYGIRHRRRDAAHGIRWPGQIGFKVEHYLSSAGDPQAGDYDRKVTETLIAGERHGCFDAVYRALSATAERLETAWVLADFEARLHDRPGGSPSTAYSARAKSDIDRLYRCRDDPRALRDEAA